MLIECLLKRPGGTHVKLDDKNYHFKPGPDVDADPRHLAEVIRQDHAERFLSISEGYCYAGEGQAPALSQSSASTAPSGMPRTSVNHSAVYQLATGEISLPELTIAAFKASGLSITEWNNQDDEDLYEQLDATLAELQVEAENQASRRPPERGNVIQPKPEEGLGEDDDLEEDEEGDENNPTDSNDGGEVSEEQRRQAELETQEADARIKAEQDNAARLAAGDNSNGEATDAQAAGTGMPSHDELVAQYKAKMGRAPSSRLSDERIYELLKQEED